MSKNHSNLSIMAGENFDAYVTQMSKTHLKLSTKIGENLKFTWLQCLKTIPETEKK